MQAKENYFQKLAEYRATTTNDDDDDIDDSSSNDDDDKPLSLLKKEKVAKKRKKSLPPPPKLKIAPSHVISNITAAPSPDNGHHHPVQGDSPPPATLGDSPPPAIQLRNIVSKPITILPNTPGQTIKVLPSPSNSTSPKVFKVSDIIKVAQTKDVQPILQLLTEENGDDGIDKDQFVPDICKRQSCDNLASSDPQLNGDYCCYECLTIHCRDIFDSWVSRRVITASS